MDPPEPTCSGVTINKEVAIVVLVPFATIGIYVLWKAKWNLLVKMSILTKLFAAFVLTIVVVCNIVPVLIVKELCCHQNTNGNCRLIQAVYLWCIIFLPPTDITTVICIFIASFNWTKKGSLVVLTAVFFLLMFSFPVFIVFFTLESPDHHIQVHNIHVLYEAVFDVHILLSIVIIAICFRLKSLNEKLRNTQGNGISRQHRNERNLKAIPFMTLTALISLIGIILTVVIGAFALWNSTFNVTWNNVATLYCSFVLPVHYLFVSLLLPIFIYCQRKAKPFEKENPSVASVVHFKQLNRLWA